MPDIFDEKAPPPPLSSVNPKLANPRISLPNPNREGSSFRTLTEKAPPAPLQRKRKRTLTLTLALTLTLSLTLTEKANPS